MKVAVIGNGYVGMAVFKELQNMHEVHEIALVGRNRLELVGHNIEIAKSIFEQVNKYNLDAIIIVLSNPVDIITKALQKYAERPVSKVIGTGTLLDTARLKCYVSSVLDVSDSSVDVMVLGEHGDSSCIIWSALRVLGMPLNEYLSLEIEDEASVKQNKNLIIRFEIKMLQ